MFCLRASILLHIRVQTVRSSINTSPIPQQFRNLAHVTATAYFFGIVEVQNFQTVHMILLLCFCTTLGIYDCIQWKYDLWKKNDDYIPFWRILHVKIYLSLFDYTLLNMAKCIVLDTFQCLKTIFGVIINNIMTGARRFQTQCRLQLVLETFIFCNSAMTFPFNWK